MGVCSKGDGNKAVAKGWCSTHYRRWRKGEDMDAPIRGYVRYEEGPDGGCQPRSEPLVRKVREKPFARETALLKSLGLTTRHRA